MISRLSNTIKNINFENNLNLHKKLSIKHLSLKKNKGNSDLISSLFVILALSVFVIFYIGVISDVGTRNNIDQVARKYILRMESEGELSMDNESKLIADLMKIPAVKSAIDGGSENIVVTWNETKTKRGYGSTITLDIKCPAMVTGWSKVEGDGTMFGKVTLKKPLTFHVVKQSTAKY